MADKPNSLTLSSSKIPPDLDAVNERIEFHNAELDVLYAYKGTLERAARALQIRSNDAGTEDPIGVRASVLDGS